MRARTYLSILSLGASVLALGATSALAQPGRTLLICRDGAHVIARDNRGCDGHRGIDIGATRAIRHDVVRPDARYPDPRYRDGRYRDGRYLDGRYGDRPHIDARRPDAWNADPRYAAHDRARIDAHRAERDQNGRPYRDDHHDGDRRP